jgi:hypothetical protein
LLIPKGLPTIIDFDILTHCVFSANSTSTYGLKHFINQAWRFLNNYANGALLAELSDEAGKQTG